MGTGRIRRVKCGFVREARKGSQAREGKEGAGTAGAPALTSRWPLLLVWELGAGEAEKVFLLLFLSVKLSAVPHPEGEDCRKGSHVLGPLP